MSRRIEFILPEGVDHDGESYPPSKEGLMSQASGAVLDAWIDDLTGPARSSLPSTCRFYFTEKGWREVGRNVVAAAQHTHQEYRIVAIKETDAQVVWRDKCAGTKWRCSLRVSDGRRGSAWAPTSDIAAR
jgi:hypothetical protein